MQQHAPKNESKTAIAAAPAAPAADVKDIDYHAIIHQGPNNAQRLFAWIDRLVGENNIAVNVKVIKAFIKAGKFAFANWLAEKTIHQYKSKSPKMDKIFWGELADLYGLYIDTCKWTIYSKDPVANPSVTGLYHNILKDIVKKAIDICKLGISVYEKHRSDKAKEYYEKIIAFSKAAGFMQDCMEIISKALKFFKDDEVMLRSLQARSLYYSRMRVDPVGYDESQFSNETRRFVQISKTMEACRSFLVEMENKLISMPTVNIDVNVTFGQYAIFEALYYVYGFLADQEKVDYCYVQMSDIHDFSGDYNQIKNRAIPSNISECKFYYNDPRFMQHFANHGYYVFAIESCKKWIGTLETNIDQLISAYHTLTSYLIGQYNIIQQCDLSVEIKQHMCAVYNRELIKHYDEIIGRLGDSKYSVQRGVFQYNKALRFNREEARGHFLAAVTSFKQASDQKDAAVAVHIRNATDMHLKYDGLESVSVMDAKRAEALSQLPDVIKQDVFLDPLQCITLIEKHDAELKQALSHERRSRIHYELICLWEVFNHPEKASDHLVQYWEAVAHIENFSIEQRGKNYNTLLAVINNKLYHRNEASVALELERHFKVIMKSILAFCFAEGLKEFYNFEAGSFIRSRKAHGDAKDIATEWALFQSTLADLQSSPKFLLKLAREMYRDGYHLTVDLLHGEFKKKYGFKEKKQEQSSLLHRSKLMAQFSNMHRLMQTCSVKEKKKDQKKDQKDSREKNHQAYALLFYVYSSLSILIHYPVDAIFFALKYVIENDAGLVEYKRPMMLEFAAILLHPDVDKLFVDHFKNYAKTTRKEVIFSDDVKHDKPFVQQMKHSSFFKKLYEAHAGTKVRNFNIYSGAVHDLSKEIASDSYPSYKVDALKMVIILCCGLIKIDKEWSEWYKPFVDYCQAKILFRPYVVKFSDVLEAVALFKTGEAMRGKISAQCSAPRA